MFVKSIMKPVHKSFTAKKDEGLGEVLDRLNTKNLHAMPVLDGQKFIGMISKEIIYHAFFESDQEKNLFLNENTAGDVALYRDLSIHDEEVFEHTLPSFKGFPVLAVVDEAQHFKGLITRYDVIEQFESAFGVKKKGIRIAFTSEESEGRIERLGDIIKSYHENVISLATFDETDKLARRIVLKIEKKDNIDQFTKKLEKMGFRILSVKEV
ncbi:CBS domain-containing protein [Halobacillus amylolyticus]|uniref:CBS domain-containing protein n=1 Tax=Halobacillus amylolyticus TaxID=2932259 RepID=A0ABY4HCP5_9BACI|nr:CBS domain-containing protein [Halobacillus amylolyticus]UOR12437.1 CBS domain-containing protein [Halobacillus amylolyticus]